MKRHRLVFVSLFLLVLPVAAAADDWPQWRGPDRTGLSGETGLADSWPTEGPPEIWKIDGLGEGYGAVAVVGDRIYVQGTRRGDSVVFALDAANGQEVWSRVLGPRLEQDKGNGPRSTPTVVGDEIYVLNGMGQLARLKASDGSVVWQIDMLDRFSSRNIRWGVSESPLIEGDWVIVMPGGRDGSIAALERETGKTVWTSETLTDNLSYSSLVAADIGGIRTIVGFTQQAGVGVRASNGELLWRYEAPANGTANAATPVVGDDMVFYTSSYGVGGGAVKVTPSGNGLSGDQAWFASNLQNHHGGVVLYEGHLYGFFGPALACVELESGEIKWRARSVGKGSLTVADGKLYLLGEKHKAGLAVATPDGYTELGRFEIADHGWPSWAYPVVSGGRLYLRNWDELTVYDVGAGAAQSSTSGGSR